jgi:hypothetical protein
MPPFGGIIKTSDDLWRIIAFIRFDGDRLGHVCCEDPLIGGHDDKIKHALKVLIAASLAESKHRGVPDVG